MHIAALVKQVPGSDGSEREMEAASRRAVAQAVELAAAVGDGECTVITVADAAGDDVLREGIAWAASCSVIADGVRVEVDADTSDPLSIAEAVANTAARNSPFDLLLLGNASPESGGLLAPTLAELLDYPFLGPAAFLSMQGEVLHVRCHRGDEWLQATVSLPAVISCAMDLIPPCEVPPGVRATVPATRLRVEHAEITSLTTAPSDARTTIGVVVEPDDPGSRASLVAEALTLAPSDGEVIVLECQGSDVAEDVARSVADWCRARDATTLVGSTSAWGQEVVGRTAARLTPTPIESVVTPSSSSAELEQDDSRLAADTIAVRRRGRLRVVSRPRRG